jgi:hypothetical protein
VSLQAFLPREDFRSHMVHSVITFHSWYIRLIEKIERMNQGKYIFTQLTSLLPRRTFDRFVNEYDGNKRVRHFTCWNQLNCMLFGQLTSRESLRDLILAINAHKTKSFHMGFGKSITLANFSNANSKRNYRIFEDFAFHLIDLTRAAIANTKEFKPRIEGNVYAIDASIIDLCLDVFWWARFREGKAGIKLNAVHDVKTDIPTFIHITEALEHDVNFLDYLIYEAGAYYILDRGYIDYSRLYRIDQSKAFFVIRAKKNTKYRRLYSFKKDPKQTGVLSDQVIRFTGYDADEKYPEKLRRVKFYDEQTDRKFDFLTNSFVLDAQDIALLYKHRWIIELFFKWIKQHMKVKTFWGTTPNAVKIQLYSAIVGYCLVALARQRLNLNRSNYEILQVLSVSYFDKTPINQLFKNQDSRNSSNGDCNQLKINFN